MDYFIFILAVIGAIICRRKKHPEKNIFYYGFCFFVLIGLSEILSLIPFIISINISSMHVSGNFSLAQIVKIMSIVGIIRGIVRAVGFIVLIFGFYKYNSKPKIEE